MFPVTEILDKEMDLLSNELYRTLIRILCVAFSVAVGISLPDFGAVLGGGCRASHPVGIALVRV